MVSSFLRVSMPVAMVNASWIMPINSQSLLDAEGDEESSKAQRQSTQEELGARGVGSHVLAVAPGFVSKREQHKRHPMNRIKAKVCTHRNHGSFNP